MVSAKLYSWYFDLTDSLLYRPKRIFVFLCLFVTFIYGDLWSSEENIVVKSFTDRWMLMRFQEYTNWVNAAPEMTFWGLFFVGLVLLPVYRQWWAAVLLRHSSWAEGWCDDRKLHQCFSSNTRWMEASDGCWCGMDPRLPSRPSCLPSPTHLVLPWQQHLLCYVLSKEQNSCLD